MVYNLYILIIGWIEFRFYPSNFFVWGGWMVYNILMEAKIGFGSPPGSGKEGLTGELTLKLEADNETIKRVENAINMALGEKK